MSLSVSAIMPQIAFAQRIREFARAMLRRVVPGIPLEKLRFESDLIFETHVNRAVYSLPETATDYDRRCAVVKVMCEDATRLCAMLKNACRAVGLGGIADEYLNHATFFNFVLEQDNAKMDLLMSLAGNGDTNLGRVFFNVARVLKGKEIDYYKLGDEARQKVSDDIKNLATEMRENIERVSAKVDGMGTKVDGVGAAVQIGFANAGQKLLECKTAIEAVGEKVSKLRRSGKAKGRYADEAKTLCWHYWTTANNREEVWRSVNTRITYKAVFEHGRKHLACVGVTSEKEFKKIIHAEAMRHNRELQTKQDEARMTDAKANTKPGENGIMHDMKNRAKPALAIALAIVGAVAAPLRSDARGGSCGCGESCQPLAKQAFRGASPQIFALTKDGKRRIERVTPL